MNEQIDKKRLKLSKYTFIVENDEGHYVVYSSMTGFILLCSEKEYIDKLIAIKDAPMC